MNLANTATLPVIVFVLGLVSLKVFDALLLYEPLQLREIKVGESQSEAMEAETNAGLEGEIKSKLMESLFDRHTLGEDILTQQAYLGLSKDEQSLVLRQLSSRLIGAKSYAAMISLAESFSIEQRLSKGIQFHYALALARENKSEQSVSAYRELLASQPEHAAASINLGLLLNRMERYQEAGQVLEKAVDRLEGHRKAKGLSAWASGVLKQNNFERAESLFSQSLEYRPDHAGTWIKLADTRSELKRPFHTVTGAFEKAIELSDNQYRYQKKYGEYLLEQLAFDQAAEVLQLALEGSRKDDQIRRLLAWAMFESDQWLKSREHWRWLSTNAGSETYRLLGEHMVLLIDQQEHSLKEPDSQKDEFLYVRALMAESDQLYSDAKQILERIELHSPWFLRTQRRLDLLSAQTQKMVAVIESSLDQKTQQPRN